MNAAHVRDTFGEAVMIPCKACGAKNPTRAQDLAAVRFCPQCKAELAPLAAPLEVSATDLIAILTCARVPLLIDFWAPWCPPCRLVAPIVNKVASEMTGKALVLKVDTGEQPEIAAEFDIRAIPTFVVIRDGKVVSRQTGLAGPRTMKRWLTAD